MKPKFYKLTKELFQNGLKKITFFDMYKLDDDIEWFKAMYARNFYWVLNEDFYEDVLSNEESKEVTLEEFQTEEGQKKYWNNFLMELINARQGGTLLDKIIDDGYGSTNVVVKIDEEYYIIVKDDDDEIESGEDVSEEIEELFHLKINPSEIEEFVKTHNAEEVEEKYAVKDYKDEFWSL